MAKATDKVLDLVFGTDIFRDKVAGLSKRAVVDRWEFTDMGGLKMKDLVATHWEPIPLYKPKISMLLNNWYCFHFLHPEDAAKILDFPWV